MSNINISPERVSRRSLEGSRELEKVGESMKKWEDVGKWKKLVVGSFHGSRREDRLATLLKTLLSFDLQRNCHTKNVVLFEENSILPLPERLEASGVKSVWGEVSQESPKNR